MDEFSLLTEKQAAKIVKQKPHTLAVWRCRKPWKAIPHIKIGRSVFYRRADIAEWLQSKLVRPSEERAA